MHYIFSSLALVFLLFGSCGTPSNGSYKIGIDHSWYPLNFEGKEARVTAFSNELLEEIAHLKKIKLTGVKQNWDMLLQNLNEKKYDAILSSMQPYIFYEKTYDFSNTYLMTGPVLVVPIHSSINSLGMLEGKELGVLQGSSDIALLEKSQGIMLRMYASFPQMLNDVLNGVIEGAALPLLVAESYTQDLYQNQLKIATLPLDDEGLRIITLYKENNALIKLFNEGLRELKQNGKYLKLLQKWSLDGLALSELTPQEINKEK